MFIWCLLIARFYIYPYTFKASFLHPTESLFVPASVVSFGTILINISQYGPDNTGPWLTHAVGILFWIDAALAIIFAAGIYLLLYASLRFHCPPPAQIQNANRVQVVHTNVYNCSDDTNLDISGLSTPNNRPSCRDTEL